MVDWMAETFQPMIREIPRGPGRRPLNFPDSIPSDFAEMTCQVIRRGV